MASSAPAPWATAIAQAFVELAVSNVLLEGFKDPKYRPAPLPVEMVEAGSRAQDRAGFYT